MTKPMVFNYADHERALEEIAKLKEDIANLQIRCRIAESETHAERTANARETHEHKSKLYGKHAGAIFIDESYEGGDRDCKSCKHNKADGCSRWECEYEPRDLVEVVRCKDCKYLGIKDLVYGYCKHRMTGITMPDDYCSHGERRDP